MNETELYAAIWRGERQGFSEQFVRSELARTLATLSDLNNKRITPQRVMGGQLRNPLTTARKYLTDVIADFELALTCGGTNLSVNQANVRYVLRQQDAQVSA